MVDIRPDDIRRIRERMRLSQPKFGEEVGVSTRTVRYWEAGVYAPSPLARAALLRFARSRR